MPTSCVVALDPIIEAIRTHVMSAERIHADDTTVPVLAKMKTVTARIWNYLRDDRPFGGNDPPAALFYYSRNRAGEHPQSHLAGYVGLMQADAFNGYNDLYKSNRKPHRFWKPPAGAMGAESSSTWRKRERPRLPPRPCGASMNCSRSSAPSTAKYRNSALLCAVRNQDRSSSSSKPGCASSEPCSHTPRRRSTISSTGGRRSPASATTVASACRTIAAERTWLFAGSERGADRAAIMATLIMAAKLNNLDRKPGSRTSWPASPEPRKVGSTSCCLGTGRKPLFSPRPDRATAPTRLSRGDGYDRKQPARRRT